MTDLQKLARWHDRHSKAWPEQSAHAKKYAETARILSVLLRVREGCRIRYWCEDEAKDGSRYASFMVYQENGTEPLRDLAELLGGGK